MPSKKSIIVIGGGGHAKVVISLIQRLGSFDLVGYTDMVDRGALLGLNCIGTDADLPNLKSTLGITSAALGIGMTGSTKAREDVFALLAGLDIATPTLVAASAVVSNDVHLGSGTLVSEGAVIQPGTSIGDAVIVNTQASVDHDCNIGDHVHIAPGAILSGGVNVGDRSLIGLGAKVLPGITITSDTIVGAGATVTKNIEGSGTYVGSPAKKL